MDGGTEDKRWYPISLEQGLVFGICHFRVSTFAEESVPHNQLPEKTPSKSLPQRANPQLLELKTWAVKT